MLDVLHRDSSWDQARVNLLLGEYGCRQLGGWGNDDFTFADSIAEVSDEALVEMCSLVTGASTAEVESQTDDDASELWRDGYVRLFLSHSALHKGFVSEVADELALSGVHGFVAHDSMEYEQPWQEQIEHGLRTMHAFVAITHPEFLDSAWCQQEVGWALGRGVPHYIIRYPADPTGFVGRTQWPQGNGLNSRGVANLILSWASTLPGMSERISGGLLAALAGARSFMEAGDIAQRIGALRGLEEQQWNRLDAIYFENDQVRQAGLVRRALAPFYVEHSRQWPPAPARG